MAINTNQLEFLYNKTLPWHLSRGNIYFFFAAKTIQWQFVSLVPWEFNDLSFSCSDNCTCISSPEDIKHLVYFPAACFFALITDNRRGYFESLGLGL